MRCVTGDHRVRVILWLRHALALAAEASYYICHDRTISAQGVEKLIGENDVRESLRKAYDTSILVRTSGIRIPTPPMTRDAESS